MAKVSVIIPVFNTEQFLERCLTSVVMQTLADIEIIILNDGSPDDAEHIILEYCANDSRITYVKHENIGLGLTRNRGVVRARGEYLAFVDSDDFLEPEMLEKLYYHAKEHKADVVCCGVFLFWEDKEKSVRKNFVQDMVLSGDVDRDFYRDYYFGRLFSQNVWDKLYRTDVIKGHQVSFGDNKRIFAEDNFFLIQLLQVVKTISFINEPLYNYVIRSGSIMHTYKPNLMVRHIAMIRDLKTMVFGSNSFLLSKVLAVITFDALVMESINVTRNLKGMKALRDSFNELKRDAYYHEYIKVMTAEKAYLLEPNQKRRLFMILTAYLMKFGLAFVAVRLFYCKYYLSRKSL